MKCDLHVHTTFSDGENTPEEMVLSAISLGLDTIGFSDHAYMERNIRYCMTDEDGYKAEITRAELNRIISPHILLRDMIT